MKVNDKIIILAGEMAGTEGVVRQIGAYYVTVDDCNGRRWEFRFDQISTKG